MSSEIVSSWGYEFDHPVTRTEEYLKLLGQALRNEPSSFEETSQLRAANTSRPLERSAAELYLGALGAKMLSLAGALADGPSSDDRPTHHREAAATLDAAAEAAGQPARIVVSIPVMCTKTPTAGRARCSAIPAAASYRAMLDREGLSGPEDLAIVGDQETVARRLQEIFDAGADEIICTEFGTDADLAETRACLEDLVRV